MRNTFSWKIDFVVTFFLEILKIIFYPLQIGLDDFEFEDLYQFENDLSNVHVLYFSFLKRI